jgi:fructan beta-fructosidase
LFQCFRNLRAEHILLENQILEPDTNLLLNLQGTTCEMIVEFEFEVAKEFGISAKKETVIGYNVEKEEIYIDRRNSGETTFNGFFPSIN